MEMIEDEIYKPFVHKDFQLERKRADEKDQIVTKERQKVEYERKRAESFAEKLRVLGIEF